MKASEYLQNKREAKAARKHDRSMRKFTKWLDSAEGRRKIKSMGVSPDADKLEDVTPQQAAAVRELGKEHGF